MSRRSHRSHHHGNKHHYYDVYRSDHHRKPPRDSSSNFSHQRTRAAKYRSDFQEKKPTFEFPHGGHHGRKHNMDYSVADSWNSGCNDNTRHVIPVPEDHMSEDRGIRYPSDHHADIESHEEALMEPLRIPRQIQGRTRGRGRGRGRSRGRGRGQGRGKRPRRGQGSGRIPDSRHHVRDSESFVGFPSSKHGYVQDSCVTGPNTEVSQIEVQINENREYVGRDFEKFHPTSDAYHRYLSDVVEINCGSETGNLEHSYNALPEDSMERELSNFENFEYINRELIPQRPEFDGEPFDASQPRNTYENILSPVGQMNPVFFDDQNLLHKDGMQYLLVPVKNTKRNVTLVEKDDLDFPNMAPMTTPPHPISHDNFLAPGQPVCCQPRESQCLHREQPPKWIVVGNQSTACDHARFNNEINDASCPYIINQAEQAAPIPCTDDIIDDKIKQLRRNISELERDLESSDEIDPVEFRPPQRKQTGGGANYGDFIGFIGGKRFTNRKDYYLAKAAESEKKPVNVGLKYTVSTGVFREKSLDDSLNGSTDNISTTLQRLAHESIPMLDNKTKLVPSNFASTKNLFIAKSAHVTNKRNLKFLKNSIQKWKKYRIKGSMQKFQILEPKNGLISIVPKRNFNPGKRQRILNRKRKLAQLGILADSPTPRPNFVVKKSLATENMGRALWNSYGHFMPLSKYNRHGKVRKFISLNDRSPLHKPQASNKHSERQPRKTPENRSRRTLADRDLSKKEQRLSNVNKIKMQYMSHKECLTKRESHGDKGSRKTHLQSTSDNNPALKVKIEQTQEKLCDSFEPKQSYSSNNMLGEGTNEAVSKELTYQIFHTKRPVEHVREGSRKTKIEKGQDRDEDHSPERRHGNKSKESVKTVTNKLVGSNKIPETTKTSIIKMNDERSKAFKVVDRRTSTDANHLSFPVKSGIDFEGKKEAYKKCFDETSTQKINTAMIPRSIFKRMHVDQSAVRSTEDILQKFNKPVESSESAVKSLVVYSSSSSSRSRSSSIEGKGEVIEKRKVFIRPKTRSEEKADKFSPKKLDHSLSSQFPESHGVSKDLIQCKGGYKSEKLDVRKKSGQASDNKQNRRNSTSRSSSSRCNDIRSPISEEKDHISRHQDVNKKRSTDDSSIDRLKRTTDTIRNDRGSNSISKCIDKVNRSNSREGESSSKDRSHSDKRNASKSDNTIERKNGIRRRSKSHSRTGSQNDSNIRRKSCDDSHRKNSIHSESRTSRKHKINESVRPKCCSRDRDSSCNQSYSHDSRRYRSRRNSKDRKDSSGGRRNNQDSRERTPSSNGSRSRNRSYSCSSRSLSTDRNNRYDRSHSRGRKYSPRRDTNRRFLSPRGRSFSSDRSPSRNRSHPRSRSSSRDGMKMRLLRTRRFHRRDKSRRRSRRRNSNQDRSSSRESSYSHDRSGNYRRTKRYYRNRTYSSGSTRSRNSRRSRSPSYDRNRRFYRRKGSLSSGCSYQSRWRRKRSSSDSSCGSNSRRWRKESGSSTNADFSLGKEILKNRKPLDVKNLAIDNSKNLDSNDGNHLQKLVMAALDLQIQSHTAEKRNDTTANEYPHQSLPPVQGQSNQTCSSVATSTHQQVYPSKQYPSSGPPPYTQPSRIDPLLSPDGAAAKFPGSHVSPTSLISPRLQRNSLSPSRNVSGITSLRGLGSSTKSPRQRYATTTLDPLTRGSRRSRYLKAVPADPQSSQRSTSRSRSRSLDRSSGSDDVVNNELVSGSRVESVTSIPLPNEPPSSVKPLLLEESHSAVPPPLSVQQSTNVQSPLPIQSPLVTQAPANIQPPLSPSASQNPSISQNPPTSQNPSTNWGLSKFAPSNSNSYTYPQVSEKSSESDEDVTPDTFQRDTTSPKINPFGSVRTLFPCVNQTKPSLINLKATVQISGFTSCKPRRIVSIPSNSPQKSGDKEQGVKRQCPSSPEYCTLKRPKLENPTVDSNPKPKIASCTITRDVETDPSTESDEFSQNEKKLQEFQKERQNVLKSIIASVEKIKQSTKKMYSETPESSPSQNLVPTAENLEKMKNVFKTALDTSPKLKNLISLGTKLECEREIIDIDSFNSKYIKDSIEIPGITPLKPIDQEKDIPSKTVKLFDHDESDSPESIIDKKDNDNRIEFGGNMELSTDEEINESNNDLLGSPRDYKQKSPFVPISPQDGLSDHLAGSIVPPVISYSESTAIPNDSKNIFDDTIASPPPQDFFESPPASPYEVNDDAVKSNETDEELNDTGWNKIGVSNVLDDNTPDDDENNWAPSLSSNISGGNSPRQPKCIPIETCGQAPTNSSHVPESTIQDYDCKDLPVKVPVLLDISEDSSTPEESLGLPKIIPLDALEDTLETVSTDLPFKNELYRDQNSDSESHMRNQEVLPPLLEGHQEEPLSPDSPSSIPAPPISPQVDYPQTYSPNSPSISLNSPASDSVPMSVLELVPNDTNVSTVLEWEPNVVDILPPESAEYENSPTQSPLIKRSKVLEQDPNVVDILPLKSAEYESSPTQIPDTLIESYPGFSKPSSPKPSTSAYDEWEESDLELMEDDSDIDDLPSSLEDLIARRDVPSENKHQNYAHGGASDTIDEPKEMEVNLPTRSSLPEPQVSHEETVYKMADSPPDSSSSPDFSDHDDDLPNINDFIQRLKHNQTTNPKDQEQKEETSAELQSNHPVAENNPETEPDSALTEMDQLRNQLDSLFSEKSNRLNVIRQLNEDEKELNECLRKGGILKLSRDITTATEDVDLTKEQKSELQKFEMQDHDILDEAPGEIIFDSACAQCLFSFPVTLTLGACGFDPGASSVDRTLSTVDPDCLLELLGTEYLELCFERVSCPDAVLEWAFLLMSVHPSRHVEQSCVKLLLHILNKQQGKGSHWVPGPLQLARVLVNYGADLQQLLPQSNMVDFTDDDLVLSTNKENNAPGDGLFRQRNPLPDLLLRPAHSIVQDNFSGVLRILAEAVARRPQLYSVQELLAMTIMLLKTSLDQGLSDHCMKYDLTVALEALLNAVPDHHWNQQMLDVCDAAPAFTNHHHNMLELVEVLPPSERGLCLQRHLSFLFLNLLCFGDIPGFSSDIKVQQLLPIIQSLQVKGPCDFYFLSSVVILIDRCVGVLPLPGSEKPDLKQLTDAMKGIMGSIREHIGNLDRSVVKDLMAQLCSKWSIKMDSMGVKQRTLFQYGRSYQVAQKLSPVTGESEPEKPESDLLPLESQSDSSSESDLDAEPDFSALSL